jgi:hypothetical protein
MRRELTGAIINSFRRQFPAAAFINARRRYRSRDAWSQLWPRERHRYGAAIFLTHADNSPRSAEPFVDLAGEHAISVWAALDIHHLIRSDCPIAWYAVEFPAAYWFAQFAVVPFIGMATSRYAHLEPFDQAAPFRPIIRSSGLFEYRRL